MIYCLTGQLLFTDALSYTAVIDCGGVGYKVSVTSNTFTKLPPASDPPQKVRLYTHMQVREDGVDLFGFHTTEELDMFRLLITVSGVGPKAAMSILSLMTPQKLAVAVGQEDAKAIAKAPNVGPKTAARIIVDLKDKLAKAFPGGGEKSAAPDAVSAASDGSKLSDAQEALLVLGYTRSEAAAALKKTDPTASLEDIIRAALTVLMKQ
jgi:Holliday junction DNA helicase RuvA